MTTWSALLGDEERVEERAAEPGFLGRLRDSLGKSRRALTGELAAAAFDPADDEAWERLEEAQFIVITHQKKTMEAADILYGVTMGADGVSEIVSRRLPREAVAA